MKNHSCCHHDHHPKEPMSNILAGTTYVCPMHPQIHQVGPGTCPICGMALEPEVMTGHESPHHELADMTRRFWVGLILTLPVFVLEMGAHLFNWHFVMGQHRTGFSSYWRRLSFFGPGSRSLNAVGRLSSRAI